MNEPGPKTSVLVLVSLCFLVAGFGIGVAVSPPLHQRDTFTTSHQGAVILRQNTRTGETWYLDSGNRWHKINEPLVP